MQRQSLIALAIALVLGLVAVYLANTFLNASAANNATEETVQVAVASVPLDYGTEVTPDKIRFASFPASSLPPGSYRTSEELFGKGEKRVVLTPMQVNEPILGSKISGDGRNASIAARLKDGMRAASVRINDVSGVAGFVQPNDSVDVLITRAALDNGRQITDVLLQDIRVLAIGQDPVGADGRPTLAATATFEVDPLAAQKLALAQTVGSLSLVLRKPGTEQDSPNISTVSLEDLRYGMSGNVRVAKPTGQVQVVRSSAPRRVVRRPAPARPTTSNVQVVRGTQGNNYEVGQYGS